MSERSDDSCPSSVNRRGFLNVTASAITLPLVGTAIIGDRIAAQTSPKPSGRPARVITLEDHFSTDLLRSSLPPVLNPVVASNREQWMKMRGEQLGHDIDRELMDVGSSRLAAMDAAGIDLQVMSFDRSGMPATGCRDSGPGRQGRQRHPLGCGSETSNTFRRVCRVADARHTGRESGAAAVR